MPDRSRHPLNVEGPWFVDRTCIDCDVARQVAPELFGEAGGQSVVIRQPATDEDRTAAWRALLACPTASIRVDGVRRTSAPKGLFPQQLDGGVAYCGYNSTKSFGANAFLAVRPEGNLLVDSPRWAQELVDHLDAIGGVSDVLLTHRDDVADADRYAARYGARVWIHEDDRRAAPYATDLITGDDPAVLRDGLVAVPVPGHTRGSVVFLLEDRYLFTGDSLAWSRSDDDLMAFRRACWFSWEAQTESLARLAEEHRFEWVLAGHGDRRHRPAGEMHDRLVALVGRMRAGTAGDDW